MAKLVVSENVCLDGGVQDPIGEDGFERGGWFTQLSPEDYEEEDIQDKVGLDLPVSFDRALAARCGVYSTPQAVLIGADHTLFYRGNYNKSRYCTDKATNYAQMAVDSLLGAKADASFPLAALKSYGCELPNCTK